MRRIRATFTIGLVCMILSMPGTSVFADLSHGGREYAVTITNLTRGQSFTPILVFSHRPRVTLFEVGSPASSELATLAEDGDIGPLSTLLSEKPPSQVY